MSGETARVSDADATAMRAGWVCAELGPRRIESTYGIVPLETLPALDVRLDGDFGWLTGPEGATPDLPDRVTECDVLQARLHALGLELPEDLRLYLCCSAVCGRMDDESTTGCWTDPSPVLRPVGHPDVACVRFLSDQQDCTAWYCWITPEDSWVVALWTRDDAAEEAMWRALDTALEQDETAEPLDAAMELVEDVAVWVAPSVEAFVYRTLLECRAWHLLHPRRGRGPDEQIPGGGPGVAEARDYLDQMAHWPPE
ncbi:hypothetical protein [Actinomyces sp. Z5]|uniref:hypothetical protein n=1 Tax=Actinomyces sp. Z5 TaxID=2250216 RepID=UPI0011BF18FC|nr:hypothetical protein [Actinomyces sp. Z5]